MRRRRRRKYFIFVYTPNGATKEHSLKTLRNTIPNALFVLFSGFY